MYQNLSQLLRIKLQIFRTFSCQSSSIDFLVAQGFDFNKAFKDGIPYLTTVEEMHLKKQVNDKKKKIEDHFSPARKQKQSLYLNIFCIFLNIYLFITINAKEGA